MSEPKVPNISEQEFGNLVGQPPQISEQEFNDLINPPKLLKEPTRVTREDWEVSLEPKDPPARVNPFQENDDVRRELKSILDVSKANGGGFTPLEQQRVNELMNKMDQFNYSVLGVPRTANEAHKLELQELTQLYQDSLKKGDIVTAAITMDNIKITYRAIEETKNAPPIVEQLKDELTLLYREAQQGGLNEERKQYLQTKLNNFVTQLVGLEKDRPKEGREVREFTEKVLPDVEIPRR